MHNYNSSDSFILPKDLLTTIAIHAYRTGGVMKKAMVVKTIRTGKYGLYFIEPQPNTNAKEIANAILGLDGVVEVQITSGSAGYVVTAKKDESEALERFIKRNALRSRYLESHYIMSKR